MGGLVRGTNWWWNYFKDLFFFTFNETRGSILLSNGHSETVIELDHKIRATKIYISVAADEIPVCAANVDMVGAIQTGPTTFIIYADIRSNTATAYWRIDYVFVGDDDGEDGKENG